MSAIRTADVKVGDILHDVHRVKAGNTTMSIEGYWTARVTAVADDGSWAEASWNSNPAKRYHSTMPKSWRRRPKEWISQRLFEPRSCGVCHASERDGHVADCEHPRAVAKRKRATKAVQP
jgi:hypothetical protein